MRVDLDELERLEKAATAGPWEWHEGVHRGPVSETCSGGLRTVVPYDSAVGPVSGKVLSLDAVLWAVGLMNGYEAQLLANAGVRPRFHVMGAPKDKELLVALRNAAPELIRLARIGQQIERTP